MVGSRWLGVVAGRLHGSALRAAQGGFVDLVSAGSAVRHGVFPVGSGECVRWLLCAGKAAPCLCGGTGSKMWCWAGCLLGGVESVAGLLPRHPHRHVAGLWLIDLASFHLECPSGLRWAELGVALRQAQRERVGWLHPESRSIVNATLAQAAGHFAPQVADVGA